MRSEQDQNRVVELQQRVADLESRLADADGTPRIVPKAITAARNGLLLSCATVFIGLCILIPYSYSKYRYSGNHQRVAFEEVLLLGVPVVVYPLLWSCFGYFILRGLQRGSGRGRRLAMVRTWLVPPFMLIHSLMAFMAGLVLWPHLDLVMLSALAYIAAEVCFAIAGILVWRARAAVR